MSLRSRIERLRGAFGPREMTEIVVLGGLGNDPFDIAEAGGRVWGRNPDEAESDFRSRVRLLAGSIGARCVVFGGLLS